MSVKKNVFVVNSSIGFDIFFKNPKMKYFNIIPNLCFVFQLDTLTFAKSVLSKISLPPYFKLKTIFEFLREKSIHISGLETHQYFSDVKSITVVFKFNLLCSNRHHKINTINNILIK